MRARIVVHDAGRGVRVPAVMEPVACPLCGGADHRQILVTGPRWFDVVTLWNVIEVIPDPLGLLRSVHPLIRPGGTLHLRTQNYPFQRVAFAATRAARAVGARGWLDRRPYLAFIFNATAFSARTIRLFLGRAGFVDVRVIPSPPSPGDPYRALDGAREWPLAVVKLAADGVARAAYVVSGSRWIVGASFEASALRP